MADFLSDMTKPEGREDGISGELVPNEDGYLRAIFTEATREELKRTFRKAIAATLEEHKSINGKREANLRAYEAAYTPNQAIDIPIVKRDVNQQDAWLQDAIFSKEPPFTVRALDNDIIQIVVDEGDGSGAQIVQKKADDYARELEALVNYYLIHRIGFKKTLRTWLFEMLRDGNRPPVLKVFYEKRERRYGGLNVVMDGEKLERIEKEPAYKTAKDGEPVRIENVPGDKFYVPFPWDDHQKAPFIFQPFEENVVSIKDKIARGIYDFCRAAPPTEDQIDMVLSGAQSTDDLDKWRADERKPQEPGKDPTLFELWFDFPFAELVPGQPAGPETVDPESLQLIPGKPATEDTVVTRMVPMCATIHEASGEWLNCYENYRWDKIRPFFVGRMKDRPFSFSAYSTAENVAPFQRLITQIFNARLKNMAVANVKTFGVREGSPSWRYFQKYGFKMVPGQMWPFGDAGDVKAEALGQPVESGSTEIAFLSNEADKMSVVTDYDRGQIPNRTPVGTVTTVDALAKMQPRAVLDQVRDTISDVLKCLVRTLAQFNPGGMKVPFRDPKSNDGVDVKVVGFPLEWKEGVFAFDIAATGHEETAQSLSMRDLMLSAEVSKFNGELMQTIAASLTPNPENGMLPPPPLMILAMTTIINRRNILARVFMHNKLNADDYLPTVQQLMQLPLELQKFQQLAQMQMMQQQPPQGGQGELSPADSGGAIPGGEAVGQPVPGMGGPPGNQGVPPGAAPPNL